MPTMSLTKERASLNRVDTLVENIPSALAQVPSRPDTETNSTTNHDTLKGFPLFIVVFSLCLAQFLSALDITIVATALPTIAEQLEINGTTYTWVASSYTLASTTSSPIWAKLSDICGRKPTLLLSNAVFMAGSLLAGLSHSASMLIAGRVLQGLGGGGIMIMVTILVADLFSLQERAKYYGLSALVWAVASALGPVLGGLFTESVSWRWCFLINLPFDAVSLLLLSFLRIKIPRLGLREGLSTFDWIGTITITGGTICFLCGLEGGSSRAHAWTSAYTLSLLMTGLVLIAAFVVYELYIPALPLIPMRVFYGRNNVAALTAAFFHAFVFISYDFFLPLYFQVVLLASPIKSGLYLFCLVIPLSIMSATTGFYIRKTGDYHYAAWFGSVLMSIGTGLFITFSDRYELWKILVFLLITGIGAGPIFISPMMALQNHLKKEDITAGTSAFTFLRSMSTSISIVIGGVILQEGLGGNSFIANETSSESPQQYTSALRHLWIFYTAICGVMVLSCFAINKKSLYDTEPCKAPIGSGVVDLSTEEEKA